MRLKPSSIEVHRECSSIKRCPKVFRVLHDFLLLVCAAVAEAFTVDEVQLLPTMQSAQPLQPRNAQASPLLLISSKIVEKSNPIQAAKTKGHRAKGSILLEVGIRVRSVRRVPAFSLQISELTGCAARVRCNQSVSYRNVQYISNRESIRKNPRSLQKRPKTRIFDRIGFGNGSSKVSPQRRGLEYGRGTKENNGETGETGSPAKARMTGTNKVR